MDPLSRLAGHPRLDESIVDQIGLKLGNKINREKLIIIKQRIAPDTPHCLSTQS